MLVNLDKILLLDSEGEIYYAVRKKSVKVEPGGKNVSVNLAKAMFKTAKTIPEELSDGYNCIAVIGSIAVIP